MAGPPGLSLHRPGGSANYSGAVTFSLHIDAEVWRSGTKGVRDEIDRIVGADGGGGLVPVVQGSGWGATIELLAREAEVLGSGIIAVATPYEAAAVAPHFSGEILVRQPWDPRDTVAARTWETLDDGLVPRVIRTIAGTEALHRLAESAEVPVPFVMQGLTSLYGVGMQEPDLDALLADDTIRTALRDGRITIRGAILHLPARQPGSPQVTTFGESRARSVPAGASNRVREAWGWAVIWIRALAAVEATGVELSSDAASIWVSRLDDAELADLHGALGIVPLRVLRGRGLWLSEPAALQAYGTVLAVHRVERGRDVGDRQRRTPKDGYVVVVGGGTANGVGIAAPAGAGTLRERAEAARLSAREAVGKVRSPFTWAGRNPHFVERPATRQSLVWISDEDVHTALGAGHRTPAVGDQWPCRTRLELATFDRVLGLD